MDDAPRADRIVDWKLLGRRLRRPAAGWAVLALVLGAGAGWAAADLARPGAPPDPSPGFRFEQVFVVEGRVDGNTTSFRVVPWFSNPGAQPMAGLEVAFYAVETPRNLVLGESRQRLGELPARRTTNTTGTFELNNTRSYTIHILILEDGLLIARGSGSIGFANAWDGQYKVRGAVALSDGFHYDYAR